MGVGASQLRKRSEWDAGEPVDIACYISVEEVIKPVKIDRFPRADESAFYNNLRNDGK